MKLPASGLIAVCVSLSVSALEFAVRDFDPSYPDQMMVQTVNRHGDIGGVTYAHFSARTVFAGPLGENWTEVDAPFYREGAIYGINSNGHAVGYTKNGIGSAVPSDPCVFFKRGYGFERPFHLSKTIFGSTVQVWEAVATHILDNDGILGHVQYQDGRVEPSFWLRPYNWVHVFPLVSHLYRTYVIGWSERTGAMAGVTQPTQVSDPLLFRQIPIRWRTTHYYERLTAVNEAVPICFVNAIGHNADVVGHCYANGAFSPNVPVVWKYPDLDPTILETNGDYSSTAQSINNDGEVVGVHRGKAHLWQPNGVDSSGQTTYSAVDLNTVIPTDTDGWQLLNAIKILDDGSIYGLGRRTGTGNKTRTFILSRI